LAEQGFGRLNFYGYPQETWNDFPWYRITFLSWLVMKSYLFNDTTTSDRLSLFGNTLEIQMASGCSTV
jgi:hypothetical protein